MQSAADYLHLYMDRTKLWEYKGGSRNRGKDWSSQINSPSREICVFFRRDGDSFDPLPSDLIASPILPLVTGDKRGGNTTNSPHCRNVTRRRPSNTG